MAKILAMSFDSFELILYENGCLLVTVGFGNDTFSIGFQYANRVMIHWETIYLRQLEENAFLMLMAEHDLFYDVKNSVIDFHR